jgi:hypothetical protein
MKQIPKIKNNLINRVKLQALYVVCLLMAQIGVIIICKAARME